jgi:hypothetical protein
MHPDIARELMNQRTREMRAEATQANVARRLRAALRNRRREQNTFVPPVIPDYVDDMVGGSGQPVPPQRGDSHATTR